MLPELRVAEEKTGRHVNYDNFFLTEIIMPVAAQAFKKRKQSQEGTSTPKKKTKRDVKSHAPNADTETKKDKGKGKETAFQVVQSSLVVSISPVFSNNPRAGVEEMLDSMIMR